MHIVFFRYLPLTQKIIEDFYMKELVSFGYEVDYWDISSLFFPEQNGVERYIPRDEEKINIKYIKSRRELKSLFKKNNDALFISMMSFGPKLIWVFHNLKRFGCRTAVFSYYPLPLHVGLGSKKQRLLDLRRIVNGLYTRFSVFLSVRLRYIKLYDYVFMGGRNGWRGIGVVKQDYLKNTKFYEVNNWDYDKFLAARLTVNKEHFIVFLDEYYPFHPDVLLNGKSTVAPERYFDDLNKVFSAIEDYYGMPVVIAAHPKALKYKDDNYFCGREVFFNSTLELVSKASFVLAHDSLSIGYAVMCKKQLIFINSNEIRRGLPHNYETIMFFSNYFHSPLLFAEDIKTEKLNKSPEISSEVSSVYEGMIEGYMSTLKEPKQNIVLLKSYLQEIFNNMLEQ